MADTNATDPKQAPVQGALHITDAEFDQMVKDAGDKPIMVDFFAEWCGPCKLAAPIIEDLAKTYAGKVVVAKLDIDASDPNFTRSHGVVSIPTVVVWKGGKEIARQTGFIGKEKYVEMIENGIKAEVAAN
jgi:thioredoxin 1